MTSEELQTLLDINSSHNFQELKSLTAQRLDALQRSMNSHYVVGSSPNSLAELVQRLKKNANT